MKKFTGNIIAKESMADFRKSGQILKLALNETAKFIKAGVTTLTLDEISERTLRMHGAIPAFKNYHVEGASPFPSSLCISVNDELVHGIPSKNRVIKDGDVVSIDLGANYKGMFTDAALTVIVGEGKEIDQKMVKITKESLDLAIKSLKPGMKTGDLGEIIQNYIESHGFCVIKDLVGHGVGYAPHTDPQIPNFGHRGSGPILEVGMAIAIEPMVSIGSEEVKMQADGWTIKMRNQKNCAHFEHTVLINKNGAEIIA